MKEHPILFSTLMVQAILENRKIMTRRTKGLEKINETPDNFTLIRNDKVSWIFVFKNKTTGEYTHATPADKKGHKLWVRETFFDARKWKHAPLFSEGPDFIYRADQESFIGEHKWKPSLFMKKEIARIWLEVTNVRCERLHDISESDAIHEGIKVSHRTNVCYYDYILNEYCTMNADNSFLSLWASINGKESVALNPWVFVYEFKRIERP